jgi:hypothetical protein
MDWPAQFQQAIDDWRAALDGFNNADGDSIDYQILRLYAAETKLALVLRQAKHARGLPVKKALVSTPLACLPFSHSESSESS